MWVHIHKNKKKTKKMQKKCKVIVPIAVNRSELQKGAFTGELLSADQTLEHKYLGLMTAER